MTESQYGSEERERSAAAPGDAVCQEAKPEHGEAAAEGTGESRGSSRGARTFSKSPKAHGSIVMDDAYYDEVRRAVGRGAPTVLLGTSTRSLERSLAKLKAIQERESAPPPRIVPEALASSDETEATRARIRSRAWLWVLLFLGGLEVGVLGVVGALPPFRYHTWAVAGLVVSILVTLVFWVLSFAAYAAAGPPVSFSDVKTAVVDTECWALVKVTNSGRSEIDLDAAWADWFGATATKLPFRLVGGSSKALVFKASPSPTQDIGKTVTVEVTLGNGRMLRKRVRINDAEIRALQTRLGIVRERTIGIKVEKV